jgi:hypothetical protein
MSNEAIWVCEVKCSWGWTPLYKSAGSWTDARAFRALKEEENPGAMHRIKRYVREAPHV